jgi:hypothetical protein
MKERVATLLAGIRGKGAAATAAEVFELQLAVQQWMLLSPVECANSLAEAGASGLVDSAELALCIEHATGGDIGAFIAMAKQLDDTRLSTECLQAGFTRAATNQPAAALQAFGTLPTYLQRRLGEAFQSWIEKDHAVALRAVFAQPEIPRSSVMRMLWNWGKKDLRTAFTESRKLTDAEFRGYRNDMFGSMVAQMGYDSPKELWQVVLQIPEGREHERLMKQAFTWAAKDNPSIIAEEVAKNRNGLSTLRMAVDNLNIGNGGKLDNPAKIEAFANALPSQLAKERVFQRAGWDMYVEDAPGAAEWAKGITDPLLKNAAMRTVAASWLTNEP